MGTGRQRPGTQDAAGPVFADQPDAAARFERLIVVGQAPEDDHAGPSMRDHTGWTLHRQAERDNGAWLDASWVQREDRGFLATLERTLNGQLSQPIGDEDLWARFVATARATTDAVLGTLDDRRTLVYLRGAAMLSVPTMLRTRRPDLAITVRLPSPWPASELFARLPWREELLRGAIGADVISVASERDRENLVRSFERYLQDARVASHGGRVLLADGRRLRTFTNPPGIDVAGTLATASHPAVERELERWRAELAGRRLVLVVVRLHPAGGLHEQLTAIERLLDTHPELLATTAFVVVASETGPGAGHRHDEIEASVARINGRAPLLDAREAVHYLRGGTPAHVLAALYRSSRVLVAAPLVAAASLAVKEYVAIQHTLGGDGRVLVSETSGTSAELPEALRCNPFDLDGVAAGIAAALDQDTTEARRSLATMAARIARHDVQAWWRHEQQVAADPTAELT